MAILTLILIQTLIQTLIQEETYQNKLKGNTCDEIDYSNKINQKTKSQHKCYDMKHFIVSPDAVVAVVTSPSSSLVVKTDF